MRLETDRLTLVPVSAGLVDALADRRGAEELLGARIPAGWPDDELAPFLTIYAGWLAENPAFLGYGPWVVIARDERAVAGSAGFVGRPKEDGEVEIGYGIDPGFQNRGYATEATRALVAWALERPDVEKVVSKCDPANVPSVRVLEKAGLARMGEAEGMLLWETTS